MKIIYVLGLEHSGTTLTDQLLSGASGVVGLGEVAGFFSNDHMRHYDDKWGHYPDAYLCSCGQSFESCGFWSELKAYSGLEPNRSNASKYAKLVEVAKTFYGDDVAIVDSSKSINGLQNWIDFIGQSELDLSCLHIVLAIKDVRSFVASMARKESGRYSLLNYARSFNYWCGANSSFFNFLSASQLNFQLSLYEDLCTNTASVLQRISQGAIQYDALSIDVDHADSHILIGNKSFIMRNRGEIRYDNAWRANNKIKCIYSLHQHARKMNQKIYADIGIDVF